MMKKKPNIDWFRVVIWLSLCSYLYTSHHQLRNYALKADVLKEVHQLMISMREKNSKTSDQLLTLRRDVDYLIQEQKDLVARISQLEQTSGHADDDEVGVLDHLQSGSSNAVTDETDSAITLEDVLGNPFEFLSDEELAMIMDQAAEDAGVVVDWDELQDRLNGADAFVAKINTGEFADVAGTFYKARQQYFGMLDSVLDHDSAFQQMMLPELEHALTQAAAMRVMVTNERDRP